MERASQEPNLRGAAGMAVLDTARRILVALGADSRANVCLDYGAGMKEAACMSVAPNDDYAAVILNGTLLGISCSGDLRHGPADPGCTDGR